MYFLAINQNSIPILVLPIIISVFALAVSIFEYFQSRKSNELIIDIEKKNKSLEQSLSILKKDIRKDYTISSMKNLLYMNFVFLKRINNLISHFDKINELDINNTDWARFIYDLESSKKIFKSYDDIKPLEFTMLPDNGSTNAHLIHINFGENISEYTLTCNLFIELLQKENISINEFNNLRNKVKEHEIKFLRYNDEIYKRTGVSIDVIYDN